MALDSRCYFHNGNKLGSNSYMVSFCGLLSPLGLGRCGIQVTDHSIASSHLEQQGWRDERTVVRNSIDQSGAWSFCS